MKILAFGDLHEDYYVLEILLKKAQSADLILCSGDISVFGHGLEEAIEFLDSLGKKVICTHGNHESEYKLKKLCDKSKNIIFIHKSYAVVDDIIIVGYGGGGFSKYDEDMDKFSEKMKAVLSFFSSSILLTHAPPYGTKLDEMDINYHVGSKSIRKFIDVYQPSVSISGHIHETIKQTDKIKRTVLVNPGPEGAIIII
jgi:uncharacterized protein